MVLSPEPAGTQARTVEIRVAASASVENIKLDADGWSIGDATLSEGLWRLTYRFQQAGERRLTATAADAHGDVVARQSVTFTVR